MRQVPESRDPTFPTMPLHSNTASFQIDILYIYCRTGVSKPNLLLDEINLMRPQETLRVFADQDKPRPVNGPLCVK